MTNIEITEKLISLSDDEYREFHSNLMPTVNKDTILGVRTPKVRALAKELKSDPEIENFLEALPHQYYEENNLHGFLLEYIKDFDECVKRIDAFLPYINNWATCDCVKPKVLGKHKDELLRYIKKWISSNETYTVRYGVNMLMGFYLDDDFKPEYLQMVCDIKTEEYYVKMVIAWYFATALAKHYDETLKFITDYKLEKWTHNKAIQKAIESNRISVEQKEYLRTLKVK